MLQIQYLESTENLKKNINASQGWTPNAGQAEAIAACLRQGRLFYEAASRSPLEIRPLELYYGTSAFAKALVLATDRKFGLNTLQQSHGVKDKSAHDARLGQLTAVIDKKGTFQQFNDSIRTLNRIVPISFDGLHRQFAYNCAESADLNGVSLSLKDIFGRLPELQDLYRATFDERQNIDFVQVVGPETGDGWTVVVACGQFDETFDSFVEQIAACRARMPFLQRWTISQATAVSGFRLVFQNAEPADNELDPARFRPNFPGFSTDPPPFARYFHDIEISLGPLIGQPGLVGGGYYMQPHDGHNLPFESLQFLGLHLLSSLVRYRPATWMHALSRSANNGRAADDAMLALIDSFMDRVSISMPMFVAEVISPGIKF
ncbi:YaaC family protein [Burkholderia orbicola]|uniref:YaaC family protein n=1 Tax=Burkholderia orbicola TaxID=2978683 RepID=UPI002FE39789